jgi:excisionase family DNA binding protein
MEQLLGTGVHIVLDEFGRGQTSLRQVCQLPISGIKIDRSVLGHVRGDRFLTRTIGAMAAMAESLSVPLVATAVQNPNQLATVVASGCRLAQGDGIARLMLAGDVVAWSGSRNIGVVAETKQTDSSPPAVGIGEAARDLRVSVSTIRRWADCGRLTSIRTPGGHRRILSADVGKEARRMMPAVKLNIASVPTVELPATAELLEHQGGEIIDAAARDVYSARTSGWFNSATSYEARRQWMSAIGEACGSAAYPEAIRASIDFFRQSDTGGATVLERDLLIGRVRIRVIHLLRVSHAEQSEIANVTRLMKAIEHSMLGDA